jgi:hypothetical protein
MTGEFNLGIKLVRKTLKIHSFNSKVRARICVRSARRIERLPHDAMDLKLRINPGTLNLNWSHRGHSSLSSMAMRRKPQHSLNTYGFLATTLPSSQMYIGVPCMRATSRAVRAARRIPQPTPAAKLSGFFGVRRVVMVRAPAISVWIRPFRSSNPGASNPRDASHNAGRSTCSQRRTRPSLRPSG